MSLYLPWPRRPGLGTVAETAPALLTGRLNWAGPRQKELWAPRLEQLRAAACTAELALVESGEVAAVTVLATEDSLPAMLAPAGERALIAKPLRAARCAPLTPGEPANGVETRPLICEVLLTPRGAGRLHPEDLKDARTREVALAFGYPACCAARWAGRLAAGERETIGNLFSSRASLPDSAHWLLAGLGIGPLRHFPCAPDCAATGERMKRFAQLCEAQDREAAVLLRQIAAWPTHWSVRSGIVEVKTPLFRWTAPGAGVAEVVYSPQSEMRPAQVAVAPTPTLADATDLPDDAIAAGWREAGFDSPFALRSRYCSLVWQWAAALRGGSGTVLHLPAGDGLLLELIREVNPRLGLRAVSTVSCLRAELARDNLKGRAAFVDPETLAPLEADQRAELVSALLARFALVAIYASDRSMRRAGAIEAIAQKAGLRLATPVSSVCARVTGLV